MNNTDRPEYWIWASMKNRCKNPKAPKYNRYGGRGITYDPEWEQFENFLRDMGDRPEGMELDRRDNNANYCKANCRWVDHKQQNRNRSDNRLVTHGGITLCLAEWAERAGLRKQLLHQRLTRGWEFATAISTPKGNYGGNK